ncbi:MAG: hypothetical protein HY548_06040 [Elusimicrobia bacterium]|nr:hypothetical protein [Elusimicrobiota bacterium]
MRKFPIYTSLAALWLASCQAPRMAMKPGVDFTGIRSIAVIDQNREEKNAVTDEVVRHLLQNGYRVTVASSPASLRGEDAYLDITVSRFQPDKQYLVPFDPRDNELRDDIILVTPVELSGRNVYPSLGVPGLEESQVFVSNATVSLSAKLMDPQSREALWSHSVTYEGLDLDSAVQGAVESLMKQFPGQPKEEP